MLRPDFIASQRRRLESLRLQILGAESRARSRESAAREAHAEEPKDAGDAGEDLARREVDQALHDVDARRLRRIDRALQKIDEGTYGLSDVSGEPIPQERLEATPEAVVTVDEAQREAMP
jgi:DnaK suppressor protein